MPRPWNPRKKIKDLTGIVVGKLTVILQAKRVGLGRIKWICRCECGNQIEVAGSNLSSGHATSCGCKKRKHGMYETPTYKSWIALFQRCYNPESKQYHRYGGRGIVVSDQWHHFDAFYKDMGECPEGMTLDRIDNNRMYCRSNCRWASRKQQALNRSSNVYIEAFGKRQTCSEWATESGINKTIISWRLKRNWAPEDIVSIKPSKQNRIKI